MAKVIFVVAGEITSQYVYYARHLHRHGTAKDIYSKFRLRVCRDTCERTWIFFNDEQKKSEWYIDRNIDVTKATRNHHNDARFNAEDLASCLIINLRRAPLTYDIRIVLTLRWEFSSPDYDRTVRHKKCHSYKIYMRSALIKRVFSLLIRIERHVRTIRWKVAVQIG